MNCTSDSLVLPASRSGRERARRAMRTFGWTIFVVAGVLACLFAASEYRDRHQLAVVAQQVTAGLAASDTKLEALNHWVYGNQGFARNRHYFLIRKLGPTPIQVLRYGGDCADKSRLLAALLETQDIPASLAMLYPCAHCRPVHTVVLADVGYAVTIADPVYDLTFPRPGGGYHSLEELVARGDLLTERLASVRKTRSADDKIHGYEEATHHFALLTTANWHKNGTIRAIASAIELLGAAPRFTFRPAWLENPKRALWHACAAIAVAGLALAMLAARSHKGPEQSHTQAP